MMRQIGFILVACLGAWACSEGGGIDETPCDPNPCTAVQPAACNGNLLETYASPGECAVVEGTVQCTYPVAQSTDCAASGQVCDPDSAACVGCLIDSDCAAGEVCRDKTCVGSSDPCDPNPCTDAPAPACNGDVAETYSSPGTCTEQDNNPICTYPVSESTDCEALGQVCDPDTVTCVDCVEDADCQSPFLVCQDHACTAGCIDDSREPNDDVASATAVQQDALWADLVLCAGTEDYYAVVAAQGDVISALIDFAHADGDLDLELIGPDGSSVVASSASSDDGEVIEDFAVDAANAGTYTFRVFGHSAGDQNVYDLLVTLGANACIPNPCTDVPADECVGNSAVSYRAVCTDVGGAAQCSYPVDQSTDCGLAGQICDPETAACVECLDDLDCGFPFEVCQDKACTAFCTDDDSEDNDDVSHPAALAGDSLLEGRVYCDGDEDFYAFPAVAGDSISVLVDFVHSDGNLDLELIGPDGSTVVASSTTTSDAEAIEDLSVGSGDEGTYTVRVYAAAGVQNVYDLLITLSDDPCFPNPCTTPPATSCTGVEVLTRYASPGDCTNNAGQAECDYQEEVIDCAASGLLCDEAGAACVECLDDADCAWPFEVCDASACTAGCQDDAYEDNDIIDTATSVSDGTDWSDLVLCGGDPDHYAVDLVANEEISVAIRFTHADGDLDLLLLDPTGTTAVGFSSSTTDDESIGYTAEQSGLHYIVVFGANVGDENVYRLTVSVFDDPCLPNPCTSAPADVCVGDVLTTYSAPGACTDNAGTPECDYPIDTQTDCTLTGGICQAAACAGRFADVGDVLVSEYLAHPLYVTAANGEWMEIHNRSADQVNLRGLVFSDASSNTFTVQDDIMLAPGDEAVLAINGDPLTNGDVAADYDYPNAFSLNDANETISISRDGALVDAVSWAASTGGASAQLDPAHLDADSNDFDEYWCDSTATWGSGTDLGSPGGDNTDCSAGTRSIDWCMVQFPQDIQANPDAAGVVYARLYIAGLTEPDPVDPVPELAAQVGFGSGAPDGTWTWFPAWPNPGWDGGGSNNDEYMGRMRVPASGDHSFAFRFSGDHGASWTACDRDDTSWDNPPLLSVAYQATFDYTPTAGLPLAIPDNDPLGASYTVNADWFTTADLTIELAITHPDAGELIVDLVNPEGTVVRLHNLSGAGTSDLSAHYGVSDTPDGPGALADYNGETAANAWTLYVIDTSATAGSGTLDSWTLHFSAE